MSGPSLFNASTHARDSLTVVSLAGDFDLLAADPFGLEIERAAAVAEERVVIDLRELTFIDSSGLRALLAACQRLSSRGLRVSCLHPPARLLRVFRVTGTDRLLPFDEAIAERVGPPWGRNAA